MVKYHLPNDAYRLEKMETQFNSYEKWKTVGALAL